MDLFGVPAHFSLSFLILMKIFVIMIRTTKIADYMVKELCPSNHLMPIIAL